MTELRRTVARNLQQARASRQLSLAELARRAQVSKTTVSQLENGQGNPTVETIWALAQALAVPISDLLREQPVEPVRVVRRRDPPALPGETMDIHVLAQPREMARMDLVCISLTASRQRRSPAHASGTLEHLYVRVGSVRVGPVELAVELFPGDFATFAADTEHVYEATTDVAEVLVAICYPSA